MGNNDVYNRLMVGNSIKGEKGRNSHDSFALFAFALLGHDLGLGDVEEELGVLPNGEELRGDNGV